MLKIFKLAACQMEVNNTALNQKQQPYSKRLRTFSQKLHDKNA